MLIVLILVSALAWYGSGYCGFSYWWIREFGVVRPEIEPTRRLAALAMGPFALPIGAWIHRDTWL